MGLRLSDLAGRWQGETVWVVGSSAAWSWLDPRFFDDKRTIAINFVGPTFGLAETAVTVSQYVDCPQDLRAMGWGGLVVAPDRKLQHGIAPERQFEPDDITVRYDPPPVLDYNPFLKHWSDDPERLFVGTTSLHAAMALGLRMGAATVITVAADHGYWNGAGNGGGYPANPPELRQLIDGHWLRHTNEMAEFLRSRGTQVYSMIPTVNLNGEGLSFRGPRATIG